MVMRLPLVHLFPSVFVLLLAGCSSSGGIQPEPNRPMRSYASASSPSAASTYSSSSSSTGTAIGRYEPPPPMLDAQAAPASIVVRPDLIEVKFAVRAEADAPETALAFLEQTIRAMQPRFAELGAGPTAMKLVMRGHHVEHGAAGLRKGYLTSKSKSEDESTKPTTVVFAVSLQGSFEYTLPAQHDYWDRARLVTKIDALREQLTTHSLGSSDTLTRSFSEPRALLRDPEPYRAELLTRWAAKRKQFAREAKNADLAVAVDACHPPADIIVKPLSLEEIELTLPITCAPRHTSRLPLVRDTLRAEQEPG